MLKVAFYIVSFAFLARHASARDLRATNVLCEYDGDCGHGTCRHFNATSGHCYCDHNWMIIPASIETNETRVCGYQAVSKTDAFLWSFFGGPFGADWFVLARGSAKYFVAAAFKLVTLGGFGVWWLVDIARILAGGFQDGHGAHVGDWT